MHVKDNTQWEVILPSIFFLILMFGLLSSILDARPFNDDLVQDPCGGLFTNIQDGYTTYYVAADNLAEGYAARHGIKAIGDPIVAQTVSGRSCLAFTFYEPTP